ncbi:MAG: hypothetical protein J5U17_12820 [Candidatus Methanoperedens sp.]|nr:hypothetical protein [Candidatus Methanoperedens sp.]MCE8426646.1 hypothetical protein [Candidatus Methanoperedens sp.]MCE8429145.1 hypothetical protein [Candidatus Methanoperedens sp.]
MQIVNAFGKLKTKPDLLLIDGAKFQPKKQTDGKYFDDFKERINKRFGGKINQNSSHSRTTRYINIPT